jgi:hypothetical protein
MSDEKKQQSKENSAVTSQRPAHETVGSSEFTTTSGAYPIHLADHPHRTVGGFIREKYNEL